MSRRIKIAPDVDCGDCDAWDFKQFFENTNDAMCIAGGIHFKLVNDRFCEMLGYSKKDLYERPFTDLIHPQDLPNTVTELSKLDLGVSVNNYENRYRHKRGHWITLLWNAVKVGDHIYAVARDITAMKMAHERMTDLVKRDHLTGLPGRRDFEVAVYEMIGKSEPFLLAYIDCDDFKKINDELGHAAGDEVLKQIAVELRSLSRNSDFVFRIGGDEFAMIVPGAAKASQIRKRVADKCTQPVSVGVSHYPQDGSALDDLLKKSDKSMYVIKRKRKAGR